MARGSWFVVREPIRDGGAFDPRDVVRSIRAPSSSVDSSWRDSIYRMRDNFADLSNVR